MPKSDQENQNSTEEVLRVSEAKRKLLEKYLSGKAPLVEASSLVPRRPRDPQAPLSPAQQQVWAHAQLAPSIPIYNEPMTIYRNGPLDVPVLEKSIQEIVRRHEIWRTTIDVAGGQPQQIIQEPPVNFVLPIQDLRHLPEPARKAEATRLLEAEAAKLLDLKNGPLWRALLLHLDEERYELFFSVHQIILDGTTAVRCLFHEVVTIYEAFSRGVRSPLPEPSLQYADYAVWQREWLESDEVSRQMEYWDTTLAGELPVLQWPNDRPRPRTQTFRGKLQCPAIPRNLANTLTALSRREGTTLFTVLLAGFAAVLHRYTGQEEMILGTVSAGRKKHGTETLAGYFLNPVPLRIDLSGNPSFREMLVRARRAVSGALSHDDVPFEHLVQRFQKTRDSSRNPLFQIVMALEPAAPKQQSGWDVIAGNTSTGASKLDLYINLDDREDGLSAAITYNPDLFDDETIASMAQHWQVVLEFAVANPEAQLFDLSLLTEEERHKLLVEWNSTEQPYPPACIHELFEMQALQTPDAVALAAEGAQLTYKELNQKANQVARHLQVLGVEAEHRVAVYMHRSLDMVVGVLGILKTGAAYLPIDPAYPLERVRFMLEDAMPAAILTHTKRAATLPKAARNVLCMDSDWAEIRKQSLDNLSSSLAPEGLAYVIYTSGSTGRPKGVMGTHRGAVNRFEWMWQAFPFKAGEVCCQKTSISFVDSIWEIFGPLLQGVKTAIAPDELTKDPVRFVNFLATQGVTRIVLVPSLLRAILDTSNNLQQRLPRLKFWVTSGEALDMDLARRFASSMPNAVLLNLYGSSEAAADSTCWQFHPQAELLYAPIGRPISNTQIYILDGHLRPVPVGVAGELYVGGHGLARGYWNRTELTSEKFLPNPFRPKTGERLYKTGDLARYRSDGVIEYVGRADHQVKIRGFRVELGEVESAIADNPQVKQAVVVAHEGQTGDKQLAAYVVAKEAQKPNARELREQLKNKLPDYMIPGSIELRQSLPLLPNGKIDRHVLALAKPVRAGSTDQVCAAPRNAVERQLLGMWKEVLGTEKIGIQDDFFELGGHSLLIPVLLSRIQRILGKKLSPAAVFQAPTIEQLAAKLATLEGQLVQVMPIQPSGSKPPFFCLCVATGPLLRDLALKMGDDQPFLGLSIDPSAIGQLETPYTLENIAGHLVQTIRELQPEGPYSVGGFCLNGLIAFEVAQQLRAQGQPVSTLALFEAVNPAHGDRFSEWSQFKTLAGRFHFRLLKNHAASLYGLGTQGAKLYLQSRAKDVQRDFRNLLWSTYVEWRLKLAGDRLANLQQILYIAAKAYRPSPYSGPAAFFRCTERRAIPTSELERGWQHLLANLELHVLEGDHLGILAGPSLQILAEKLKTCLSGKGPMSSDQLRTLPSPLIADSESLGSNNFCGLNTQCS
jgi:amino acid adenylation domain-containing protein